MWTTLALPFLCVSGRRQQDISHWCPMQPALILFMTHLRERVGRLHAERQAGGALRLQDHLPEEVWLWIVRRVVEVVNLDPQRVNLALELSGGSCISSLHLITILITKRARPAAC